MDFKKFVIATGVLAYVFAFTIGCAAKKTEETDESSEEPTTAPVSSVAVTASSTSQTRSICFALTATAIGSSGSAVSADVDANFTLAATSGTGTFYTDSGCTSSTTSSVITSGSSTKTLYFKSTTIETTSLQATFNSVAGTTWSGTIYGPNVDSIQMAATQTGSCVQVSVYYKIGSSTATLPYNSTVT